MRRSGWRVGFLVMCLLLAGCDALGTSTSSALPTATAVMSPTPTLPTGDYAFIRDGDIWAHTGGAPAHALTQLHLSSVGATWGSIVWSPDHTTLAFVLNAPPFAPGYSANNPAQSTGTLFTLNVAAGTLTLADSNHGRVPLLGQHVAWARNSDGSNTLFYTNSGTIYQLHTGTVTPLAGPANVWELAVRGTTLFYSTIAHLNATSGTGTAELHRFDFASHKDALIAKLGPATLPCLIKGLVCQPDTSTPAVPYTWSVSGDGSLVAYQTVVTANTPPAPTPTPVRVPSPTPTQAAALSAVIPATTPPPNYPNRFFVAQGDGSKPQQIFAFGVPTLPNALALALSPNGQNVALALATPGDTPIGPFLQPVAGGTVQSFAGNLATVRYVGIPSWSPDSAGFTLTAYPLATRTPTPNLITFLPNGQTATLEQNGAQLVWGP